MTAWLRMTARLRTTWLRVIASLRDDSGTEDDGVAQG
jgi:hypothetical protein